ncbi:MAG TPA: hypothetical protein DIV47_00425 [Candidatus Pacebacteria bacterium]|nr:hypothetical protein [Candidatus Paceibacterota bacterium]
MAKGIIQFYRLFGLVKHRILYTVFGFSSRCKHTPSCSRYAEIQIREHGTIVGSLKGLARLLTCW